MKNLKLALLMLGVAVCGPALAQKTPDRVLFYLGGSVGKAEGKEDVCASAVFACDRKDTTMSGFVGLMFNKNYGIEVGYRDLGRVQEQNDGMGNVAKVKGRLVEGLFVAAFPVDPVTFYAKTGAYRAKLDRTSNFLTEGSDTNNQWTYGVGARWDILQHFGVTVDWQRYNNIGGATVGFRSDVNILTGSAVIRF